MNAALMHAATNLSQNPPNPEPHPTRCNAGYMLTEDIESTSQIIFWELV